MEPSTQTSGCWFHLDISSQECLSLWEQNLSWRLSGWSQLPEKVKLSPQWVFHLLWGCLETMFLGTHPPTGHCVPGHMPKEGKTNAQTPAYTHKWHINEDTISSHYGWGKRDWLGCRYGAWMSGWALQVSLLYLTPCWSLPWRQKGSVLEVDTWKKKYYGPKNNDF